MAKTTQDARYLHLTTPLGKDFLVLTRFTGEEAISRLFHFELEMVSDNDTKIEFDKIVGQPVTFGVVGAEGEYKRDFNGIVIQFVEGGRDEFFTEYRATVVPKVWQLTQIVRSRLFQHLSVPEILKKVLAGFDVSYEIQGQFEPREYVTQYRESDFDFACRLMEEEGIYYFFKLVDGSHKMVVANTPQSHQPIPGQSTILFEKAEGGVRDDLRVSGWEKVQNLGSGKFTLWDHNFQLPYKHLEADKVITESVTVGTATHKLKLGNDAWEVYDYPGEYAKREDGIDKGGGEQPAELQKIFDDNKRTVQLRMQQAAAAMLAIRGSGTVRNMVAGYKFSLQHHFDGDGPYTLTSVYHAANEADLRSQESSGRDAHYENSFTAIPATCPFRPGRHTPRPFVRGAQTATVVGPPGEEIFTDKYGRVKVQFHWDREGKHDANSSCWLRVGTPWAGQRWGAIHIPRIGQEVIVEFLEGDPDAPIIVGSVYNADMMPPWTLPANKTQSGIISRSSLNGTPGNFNAFRFEDKKGSEQVWLHAEKNQDIEVENDETHWVGHDQTITIDRDRTEHVKRDEKIVIDRNRNRTVKGWEKVNIQGDLHTKLDANHNVKVGQDYSLDVGMQYQAKAGMKYALDAGMEVHVKSGMNLVIESGVSLTLKVGGNFINISPAGVAIQGVMVLINSGGAPGAGSGSSPKAPEIDALNLQNAAASAAGQGLAQMNAAAAAAGAVVSSVAQSAMGSVSQVANNALGMAQQLGQMGQAAAAQVMNQINGAVNQAQGMLTQAVGSAQGMLNSAINEVSSAAQQAAQSAMDQVNQLEQQASQTMDQAQQAAQQAANAAQQACNQAMQQGQQMANQAAQAAQAAAQQAQQAAQQAQQQLQNAANQAQAAAQQLASQAQGAANQAMQQGQQALNQAQAMGQQAMAQGQQMAQQAVNQAAQAAQQAQQAAQQAVNQAQQAVNQAQAMGQQAMAQGQQAAQQAAQQVQSAAQQGLNQAQQAANQAQQAAQQAAGQAQAMAQQTAAQAQQAAQQAQQQVSQAAQQAQAQVQQATQQATQAAQQAGQMAQQTAQQVEQQVGQAAQQAASSVSSTATQAYGAVSQQAAQASQGVQNAFRGLGR